MKTKKVYEKVDIYQTITNRIIEQLEKGVIPWQKVWKMDSNFESKQKNIVSKKSYKGINVMLLEMQGYKSNLWLSYKQAKDLGGKVKKGEKGTPIIFWKMLEKQKENDMGEKEDKLIPMLKHKTVFNIEQTEDVKIPEFFIQENENENENEEILIDEKIELADKIISLYKEKPKIETGGDNAYYSPKNDNIKIPEKKYFNSIEEYYSVLFHELTHSTGHKNRLKREEVTNFAKFGSHRYSMEELVAEIGACFLCSHASINTTFDNSVSYINSWLSRLKNDKKLIIGAASKATQATRYILDIKENYEDSND